MALFYTFQFLTYSKYNYFVPENIVGVLSVGHFSPPVGIGVVGRCVGGTSKVDCSVENVDTKGRTKLFAAATTYVQSENPQNDNSPI